MLFLETPREPHFHGNISRTVEAHGSISYISHLDRWLETAQSCIHPRATSKPRPGNHDSRPPRIPGVTPFPVARPAGHGFLLQLMAGCVTTPHPCLVPGGWERLYLPAALINLTFRGTVPALHPHPHPFPSWLGPQTVHSSYLPSLPLLATLLLSTLTPVFGHPLFLPE